GSNLATATPVSVAQGQTTTAPNAALTLVSGAISGAVTDGSGRALAGAIVTAYDTAGNVVRSATTAADGSYSIAGLNPGFYRVGFGHGGYDAQMYSNAASFDASQAFYVAPAQTASGIDAALTPAPGSPQQPEAIANPLPSVTLGPFLLLAATTRTRLAHGHRFSLALTCLDAGGCDVRATASLKRHGHRTVVAVGAIALQGASNGRITLRLRPVGIKLFRREHRHLRVTVRVAVGASGAPTMSDSESVVIV
ncbi:MAG TPA: carboxypeptidase-like regulatory domain-containing protein, partial [Solirubrobacteraceae bacterium]